jgi:hypothetical protein
MGLTDLGEHLLREMVKQRYIIEIDHMSVPTADESLDVIEELDYPGVITSHSWSHEAEDNPRIRALGGMVSTGSKSSVSFVEAWKRDKKIAAKPYRYGFGFGADTNGLAKQAPPRVNNDAPPVTYPFKSRDGRVTFDRLKTGEQTWDINEDGAANYGLIADWLEDIEHVGGPKVARDVFNSAEAYLETWERAEGVPGPTCIRGPVGARGVGKVRLGMPWQRVLRRAGQPASRPGKSFRWCGGTRALFRGGKVVLVGKTSAAAPVSVAGRKVFRGAKPVAVTSLKSRRAVARAMIRAGL